MRNLLNNVIALVIVGVAFIWAVMYFLTLRLDEGGVYQPYSSFRSDPLGSRAFYESLEKLPGISVERNLRRLDKLGEAKDSTMFYLGWDARFSSLISTSAFPQLHDYVLNGGRLIVSFLPVADNPFQNPEELMSARDEAEDNVERRVPGRKRNRTTTSTLAKSKEEPLTTQSQYSLGVRLNVEGHYRKLPIKTEGTIESFEAEPAVTTLTEVLTWHSALYFETTHSAWQPLYVRGEDRPVILERKYGAGSVVLLSDSYLFSNEAMKKEARPELLAHLVGNSRRVIFDETHHGEQRNPGIMTLARQYRMHGLGVSLLLLAFLFIWRNTSSFLPPHDRETDEQEHVHVGQDTSRGLINMLRRNVPRQQVLSTCFTEWLKANAHTGVLDSERARRAAEVAAQFEKSQKHADPVSAYAEISRILNERK